MNNYGSPTFNLKATSPIYEWSEGRMYAICLDLRMELLDQYYPGSYRENAYADIYRVLKEHGFTRQQGTVYFSKLDDPVKCVLAIQDVQKRHPWFRSVVRDVRMLRIEDNNDLMQALGNGELPLGDKTRSENPRPPFDLN